MWEMLSFVLNGFAFILIGLQLRVITEGLHQSPAEVAGLARRDHTHRDHPRAFVWVFPATYLPRPSRAVVFRKDPSPPARAVVR